MRAGEGEFGQFVRAEETNRIRIIARFRMPSDEPSPVQDENRRAPLFWWVVINVNEPGDGYFEISLLQGLSYGRLRRILASIDEARGNAPFPLFRIHRAPDQQQLPISFDQHPNTHLRVGEVDEAT